MADRDVTRKPDSTIRTQLMLVDSAWVESVDRDVIAVENPARRRHSSSRMRARRRAWCKSL
jgi:hypothetical protein